MIEPRKIGRRLLAAHKGFQAHDGTLSAASIAYYIALSFFPLLLVLVAGLATFLEWTKRGKTLSAGYCTRSRSRRRPT